MTDPRKADKPPATPQLEYWKGEFGDSYIERNDGDFHALRGPFFREILADRRDVQSILEVGCNVSWNLKVIADLGLGPGLTGVEPNRSAVELARSRYPTFDIREGTAFDLPFGKDAFDLVMTVGVLIHIAPADLPRALREMLRVSARYLLTIEYFSETPVTVPYRGLDNALFKRNWLQDWRAEEPGLEVLRTGDLHADRGFDECRYWLMAKRA